MAKKKVTNPSHSHNHKTEAPPPMEDPSVQIQNLKNLNSVLLKETTHHRQQIESLQSALHCSKMDADSLLSDKNFTLELEKTVLFVFTETQMKEMGFRFERLVGENNEREYEVAVLKGQVNDLENEKVFFNRERDQLKAEAEKRERKVREEMEKLSLEGQRLFEERCEKERKVQELIKDRDFAVRNSQESAKVIDGLMKEKIEIEMLNNTQEMKFIDLERELMQLNESLKDSRNEEALMRAKILELEGNLGLALEKEEEMAMKNSALLREKKEMEKTIEVLTERIDSIYRTLDMVQKELENKQRELDEINRARDEIEQVKVNRENEIVELQGEMNRLRDVLENLRESCREFEEKNEQLLSQVQHYRNAVDEVKVEKDNIRKGFDEEKKKVENLELQVAGMQGKIEQAAAELDKMRSEKEKLNERNKMLESRVDVLIKEKDALQSTLLGSQRECDDLRGKVEFSCTNSNQALAMLKSTAALVCDKESGEEVVPKEKKLEGEIHPYAKELDAIKKAFKSKNEMVDDMKQQLVSLQKSEAEAHKGKTLWTAISSATTIFAAVLAAYVAKGR